MQSLQKALPQLVNYTKKNDDEFKSQFVSSLSDHLKSINASFQYFNKIGLAIRSYYSEENDSYSEPTIEGFHFDIDSSAFTRTDFTYGNKWTSEGMNIGNVTIFPMAFMLLAKKNNESNFVEEEFGQVISSLNNMIYSVVDHVIGSLVEYTDLSNFNIVFDCQSGTVDYGEY